LEILATLAALAGVAAENVELLERIRTQLSYAEQARAELEESQRRLAEGREAERLHLARELHDGPIQDLYAIHLQLGDSDIVGIPSSFDGVTNRLLQVIHDLRDICTKLRPPALAYFGLEAAIQSLANSFRKTHPEIDVDVEIKCNGNNRSPQLELALFRIYQEALSNVSQHAGASQVKIRLHDNEEQLLLEIIDDGHGFEVPDRWIQLARKGHLGLLGASERAESIGGTLQISSGEESGTRLSVLTPHFV
jgi:signal transduction histidine kinase